MRIGIYRSCGIGDAVQLTPLFQQIRADLPQAEVTFFTSANVAGVLEGCPLIDQTVTFSASSITGAAAEWGGLPIWHKISRHGAWDVFLDLEPRWRRSLGFPLVRAARKGGLQSEGWKPLRLFDEYLSLDRAGLDRGHSSERYLELWRNLTGYQDRGFSYDLSYLQDSATPLPQLPSRFVCLVPGAGNPMNPGEAKRWPFDSWLRLAERLSSEGFSPVWLGSPDDARQFPVPAVALNLMGQLDLRQNYQIIARSVALIGNDSGLFHVALATRAKAVGLFGPTNPQRTGPFRNPNALVLKAGFGRVDRSILEQIKAGTAMDALDSCVPMSQLDLELVSHEVIRFLTSTSTRQQNNSST